VPICLPKQVDTYDPSRSGGEGEEAEVTGIADTDTRLLYFVVSDRRARRPDLRRADRPSLPDTVSTVAGSFG